MDYPAIRATLEGPVLDLIVGVWSELAGEHSDTGQYAAATTFERLLGYNGHPLAVAVANTAPHARVLDDGHMGFHLPSRIDWAASPKARMSKRGVRYLRIPFRHGTPGTQGVGSGRARTMMPSEVYRTARLALGLVRASAERQATAAAHLRGAGTRMSRPYNVLTFPVALRDRAIRTEGHPGYTWRSRTYEGLFHVPQTGAGGKATGGAYYTIRTLTEDSVGWYIGPFAGYHITDRVIERVQDPIRELVGDAARVDVVEACRIKIGEAA